MKEDSMLIDFARILSQQEAAEMLKTIQESKQEKNLDDNSKP